MTLNDYKRMLTLRYDQFIVEYAIGKSQIEDDVRYEKIADVTRVKLGDNQFCFFKNGDLKMIYISDDAVGQGLWDEFNVSGRAPDAVVRSRAGKTSNQLVFAGQGFSVSLHGDTVDFIEVYPACSLDVYLSEIYREQRPFIR